MADDSQPDLFSRMTPEEVREYHLAKIKMMLPDPHPTPEPPKPSVQLRCDHKFQAGIGGVRWCPKCGAYA